MKKCFLYAGIVILWSFGYYKILYQTPFFVSIDEADKHTFQLLLQHIIVNLPLILYLIAYIRQKKLKSVYCNIPKGKICRVVLILVCAAYLCLLACAIKIIGNVVTAAYMAIFYLLFVAAAEEFLYRGILPSLLENHSPAAKWLLPNTLFSLSHIVMLFVYDNGLKELLGLGWQLPYFLISTLLFGLLCELAKRKCGSLYIAIMIHAIYDFYGEIALYL